MKGAARKSVPAGSSPAAPLDFEALWQALPQPTMLLDEEDRFRAVNPSAELFFSMSSAVLAGRRLAEFLPAGSRVGVLTAEVRRGALSIAEYDMELHWLDHPPRIVDALAAATPEREGWMILQLHPRAIAGKMDRSLAHRGAARSISGLAAALAHEIRNPLAGISGAAQLLEMGSEPAEAELAQLIQEEARRIRSLVDRMENFTDLRPLTRKAVNLHQVLDLTRRAAEAGFGRGVKFVLDFDPSLPAAPGDSDQLVQVFQNLVKNAAEAAGPSGTITLKTSYRAGLRLTGRDGRSRESLPLEICVIDDGPGVPEDLAPHVFEPFVTSKGAGVGLGLALVSKIVVDHGGLIECDSRPGRTVFRVLLPVWTEGDAA
ncbi:ATP-binding protein [Neomegalonema sp.]|uniref:two-component system sensor histidine kinase NtrB n=1 Tax=Neomegalonema sp. TaxID=2039713 RepID=UPI002605F967|nr:ATP-binding protein [Neomegalonema sp.]MDD2867893.1 ATP-binding protein [Neomegalonema sp.]